MEKIAIAVHSFIHNHVDVSAGEIVTGLSNATLSDLEKNGLVRFEVQDDGTPAEQGNAAQDKPPVRQSKTAKPIAKPAPKDLKPVQQTTEPVQQTTEPAQQTTEPVTDGPVVEGQATSADSQVSANDAAPGAQGE